MTSIIRAARRGDVTRMQLVEVDADQRFRLVGLDAIADSEPTDEAAFFHYVDAGAAWVAILDDAIVGYAMAAVVDAEAYLDQVSVVTAAAGLGIGAELIDWVCRWASESKLGSVALTTFRDVPWNGPYYERLGFAWVPDAQQGPELASIRWGQKQAGIDVLPRIAMRKQLEGD